MDASEVSRAVGRWTICRRLWFLQALALLAVELGGLRRHGLTVQSAVLLPNLLLGIGFGMWAAGKAPQFILLLVSVASSLVLAEVSLRVAMPSQQSLQGPNIYRFDKKLGWRLEPGASTVSTNDSGTRVPVKINAAGFRDREYGGERANDTQERIAVLGDSFVANLAVEQPDVFTARMHAALQPRFDVRNYGVAGYGQVQELVLLDEVLESFRPSRVLVVVYTRNDFSDNVGDFGVERYKRPECRLTPTGEIEAITEVSESDRYPEAGWFYGLLSNMRLHGLLQQGLYRLAPGNAPARQLPPEVRLCALDWRPEERHAFDIMKSLLTAMARKSAAHGATFGVVVAPSRWQVEDAAWSGLLRDSHLDAARYDRTLPDRMILDFCREAGYPCLDLLPTLRLRAEQGEDLYFRKRDEHWTALAQVRVAETILGWLQERMP